MSTLTDAETNALKFSPPKPPNLLDTSATFTKIKGYFNPNPWPVHVANSLIGISKTINNRGEYLTDMFGVRTNDPRLMQHVGPNMLAVELSEEEDQPITYWNVVVQNSGPHGFAGHASVPTEHMSRAMRTETQGKAAIPSKPVPNAPPVGQTPAKILANAIVPPTGTYQRNGSVTGMTVEQARAMKLTDNARPIPEDEGIADSENLMPQGSIIPTLRNPAYPRPKNVDMTFLSEARPENAAQAQTLQLLRATNPSLNPDLENAVTPAISSAVQTVGVTAQTTRTVVEDGGPGDGYSGPVSETVPLARATPKLPPENAVGTPSMESADPGHGKFVDPHSGKRFQFRSYLERFVNRNYDPDKAAGVLALYPKGRK